MSFLGGVVNDYEARTGGEDDPASLGVNALIEQTLKEHAPKPLPPSPTSTAPSPNSRLRLSLMREKRRLQTEAAQADYSAEGAQSASPTTATRDVVQVAVQQKKQQLQQLAGLHTKQLPSSPRARAHTPGRSVRERGKPMTHSQMQHYLQPEKQRLTQRQVRSLERVLQDADMHRWLTAKTGHFIPRTVMTEERKEALRECFQLMDSDGSGEIDFSELAVAMRALGFGNEEIREAIKMGDTDGDGQLNFDEFVNLISQHTTGKASEDSFPFALIADSYRISRLVDSYNPQVRDAALGLASPAATASLAAAPATAAATVASAHGPASPRAAAPVRSLPSPASPRSTTHSGSSRLPPLTAPTSHSAPASARERNVSFSGSGSPRLASARGRSRR